jgi:Zn-dependent protease with chaperone function
VAEHVTAAIPAWTGVADPGRAAVMIEERQREAALRHIAEVAAAFPAAGLQAIDFQFVRTSTPNAFTARVAKDDSYAIGLDHAVPNLLHTLFVAALLAHQCGEFKLFGVCAARLVGLFFIGQAVEGLEDDMWTLNDVYQRTPASTRSIVDGFGEAVVQFVITHELGHVALGHFARATAPSLTTPSAGTIDVSAFDHQREFDADAWAMEAMLQIAGKDVRRLTFAAAVRSCR